MRGVVVAVAAVAIVVVVDYAAFVVVLTLTHRYHVPSPWSQVKAPINVNWQNASGWDRNHSCSNFSPAIVSAFGAVGLELLFIG